MPHSPVRPPKKRDTVSGANNLPDRRDKLTKVSTYMKDVINRVKKMPGKNNYPNQALGYPRKPRKIIKKIRALRDFIKEKKMVREENA